MARLRRALSATHGCAAPRGCAGSRAFGAGRAAQLVVHGRNGLLVAADTAGPFHADDHRCSLKTLPPTSCRTMLAPRWEVRAAALAGKCPAGGEAGRAHGALPETSRQVPPG
jgi:hypothetical protein